MNGKKYRSFKMIGDSKLPYLLVIPDEIADGTELVVESLNKESDRNGNIEGFNDRSTPRALETVKRLLASIKDAPIMIPMIPSREGEGYYQELSKDSIVGKSSENRIDLQCIEAIKSTKRKVKELTGKSLSEKIFLSGYSASGVFAQRFALIHPEIVSRCCVGGAVGSIPIPDSELPYPCGIKDFEELFGKEFDKESYRQIDFAYYVGEHEASRPGNYDRNGNLIGKDTKAVAMPMHDMSYHPRSMDTETGRMLREKYGETMQDRLDSATNYYRENGYSFKSKIYRDVAHNRVTYRDLNEASNDNRITKYFGLLDVPNGELGEGVPQRVLHDISKFYTYGTGFEPDDKSVKKLDMHEQEQREIRTQDNGGTRLEQLDAEQRKLMYILDKIKKQYEQIKSKVRGKDSHEQSK